MKEFKDARLHSSLGLQILLFLNVYLVPIWLISSMHFLWCQMYNGSPIENTLTTALATAIASPVEVFRLYFGYSGNLRELIPDFGGFWILSTFVSLPMHIYMLFAEYSASQTLLPTQFLSIHPITQAVVLSLLIFEVLTAFYVIRHLSEIRVKQFHLNHLLKNTYKSISASTSSSAPSDVDEIKQTLPSAS